MIYSMTLEQWRSLRAAARANGPIAGRHLRLTPTRRTKDGNFLYDLVNIGLLEVVGEVEPLTTHPGNGGHYDELQPFWTLFRLTPCGKHAAEYGEFDPDVNYG